MNRFDERYEIRLANKSDITFIMTFIDENWKKNHILALDRTLFEYEYVFQEEVNFVLAIDKHKKSIEGIFGFLNASNPQNTEKKDIWGSIWKVKDNNMPLLGVELTKRVVELTKCRMQIGNGANMNTTVPLRRKIFKDRIDKLKHYYLINETLNSFHIVDIINRPIQKFLENTQIEIIACENMQDLLANFNVEKLEDNLPYKDMWYIEKRFYNHPYYDYKIYLLKYNEGLSFDAIVIFREVEVEKSKALRIVDYYGEDGCFSYLGEFLKSLIIENNYEYIDFYTHGFNENIILNAGFNLKDETSQNVIPNYFEPFVKSNVDIWVNYAFENTKFFKADSDQDRPNIFKRK